MSTGCCEELIDVSRLAVRQRRVLIWVMLINLATFVMMVTGSVMSGSSALLSGTLDNFGDALAYMVSLAVVGASVQVKAKAAMFKSLLIGFAAFAVLMQLILKGLNPEVPIVETMGIAAILNLVANSFCLMLLTPHRSDDVNMASVWECSRNDVFEGFGVIVTAVLVYWTGSAYPDLIVAVFLLALFTRSAVSMGRTAWRAMQVA
ncbi:MAG: cation transporter [Pseudomonadales bacterium]|nr:cation transporter [Pseudomonadales bacterium]